jgi:negative regulator of genetic competence, sporulation and motility
VFNQENADHFVKILDEVLTENDYEVSGSLWFIAMHCCQNVSFHGIEQSGLRNIKEF